MKACNLFVISLLTTVAACKWVDHPPGSCDDVLEDAKPAPAQPKRPDEANGFAQGAFGVAGSIGDTVTCGQFFNGRLAQFRVALLTEEPTSLGDGVYTFFASDALVETRADQDGVFAIGAEPGDYYLCTADFCEDGRAAPCAEDVQLNSVCVPVTFTAGQFTR